VRDYLDINYWTDFFTGTAARKRLTENFISLSVLQGLNYLLPLITLPYLVRVLGPEKFGLIAFAQAFTGYFQILTDYGFNLSATREISIHREDKQKVNEIFSSVMTIKIFLCIISFLLLSLFLIFIPRFRSDWLVYLFSFGIVVGNVLFPVWFFQGIERMKYITILNIISKVIFTICIFIVIRKSSDYLYVPLLNSLGYIIAGLLSLKIVFKNFYVVFLKLSLNSYIKQLKDGLYLFIGTIGVNFYKNNSVIILGLLTNNIIVGYFSIAKKIIDILNQIAVLISQVLFPYISKIINQDIEKSLRLLKKIGAGIFTYTSFIGIIFLIFPGLIIKIVTGNSYYESILSLKIMAFVPLFIGANVPAVQILLSKGFYKQYSAIILKGALLDIIINLSLVPFLSYIGSCISTIVVELFVTIYLIIKCYKLKVLESIAQNKFT